MRTQLEEKRAEALAGETTASLRQKAREAEKRLDWFAAGCYYSEAARHYPGVVAGGLAEDDRRRLCDRARECYLAARKAAHRDYQSPDGVLGLDPLTGATTLVKGLPV